MPTYEYRCPEGHTFELFQRITDAPSTACEVCGASPVERVLYPVAVHFKGSGFYSTDYGKGKKRDSTKDDGGGDAKKTEKKPDAASTDKSPKTPASD